MADAKPKRKARKYSGRPEQDSVATLIDNLTAFEDFTESILPALRRDIKAGMTPEDMRKKYASLVQARTITTAITSDDGRAMAAAKDILDRNEGRATEKKEITHRYADMKDEELDAILQSEEDDLQQLIDHTEQKH